ncbi:hypothetical protein HHI36_010636 [Cryptolaemus montrouzieri]|uniref:Uncharacterized protein n=1 Tax=Cryptolaemus montrouzieri TaxID=559131 RepID=A0ABD2MJD0_9CUCU
MSRILSEKTIEEILNEDSDPNSVISDIPEERCSDNENISGCEEPVTLASNDNENVDSHVQASSSESEGETVAGPSQFSYYGKNKYKWYKNPPASSRTRQPNIGRQRPGLIAPAVSKSSFTIKE